MTPAAVASALPDVAQPLEETPHEFAALLALVGGARLILPGERRTALMSSAASARRLPDELHETYPPTL